MTLAILIYFYATTSIYYGATATDRDSVKPRCMQTNNQNQLNSFLWTVKKPGSKIPSYFFGTIHVPYTRVWDFIPENTKTAFRESDYVFFELDLTDTFTLLALSNCQLLPKGQSLANILPKDLYMRLKRHLQYVKRVMPSWMSPDQRGRGIYPEFLFNAIAGNWERKRPVWVMLMVNALTKADIRSKGIPVLDLYLAREASRLNKRTGAVEKVEEQCIPLNHLNISQVLFALNQTLWQHESYRIGAGTTPYTTDDLIRHYNCGDLNSVIFMRDTSQLPKILTNDTSAQYADIRMAQKIDEYFKNELIYKRNARMAGRVTELLENHPKKSFFFAFGAGHFLGNNTILDHLRKRGYTVTHTKPNAKININKKKNRKRNKKRRKGSVPIPIPALKTQYPLFTKYVDPYVFTSLDHNFSRKNKKPHRRNKKRKNRRRHGRRKNRKHPPTKKVYKSNYDKLWVKIATTAKKSQEMTTQSTVIEPYTNPNVNPQTIYIVVPRQSSSVSVSPNTSAITFFSVIIWYIGKVTGIVK